MRAAAVHDTENRAVTLGFSTLVYKSPWQRAPAESVEDPVARERYLQRPHHGVAPIIPFGYSPCRPRDARTLNLEPI